MFVARQWGADVTPLLMQGMQGFGDNLLQRAVLRQLMLRYKIWLESSSPWVYHDLIAQGLRVIRRPTIQRTQTKNAEREASAFSTIPTPAGAKKRKIWYTPDVVRKVGFLGAMMDYCKCDAAQADYRLPVPHAWQSKADRWLERWQPRKPLMIYRPLVERTEWTNCDARNPDHAAYAALFASIRDKFFVVSVADLAPGMEWTVGQGGEADAICHAGELDWETLTALIARAALVFCSPGFAIHLAQAVATPVVCVFGGHEASRHYVAGAKYAPFLGIDPVEPCECFSRRHECRKAIDMPVALRKLREFVDAVAARRPIVVQYPADRLERTAQALHEPRRVGDADRAAAQC